MNFFSFSGFSFCTPFRTLGDIVCFVVSFVNVLIPILVGLALLGFFWGIFRYGFAANSDDGRAEARRIMIWGLIGLFVMVSIWGILRILVFTFLR